MHQMASERTECWSLDSEAVWVNTFFFFVVVFKLKLDELTSRRTILHSCLSSRMLSTVAHRPPEMFWQLSDSATHPLSSELRAAPTARLAQRT